jgi:hypothetical protein
LLLACVWWSWGTTSDASAQEIRGVGAVVGRVESRQVWSPPGDTGARNGWAVGAFVDVAFPPNGIGAQVEGLLVQRGTTLTVDLGGEPLNTELETDYLTMPILFKARWFSGTFGVSAVAGPVLEFLLRTRADPALAGVYEFEKASSWSVAAGIGVEGLIAGKAFVGAEVRVVEGIGLAYDAPSTDVRYRSTEFLIRLGARPRSERSPR